MVPPFCRIHSKGTGGGSKGRRVEATSHMYTKHNCILLVLHVAHKTDAALSMNSQLFSYNHPERKRPVDLFLFYSVNSATLHSIAIDSLSMSSLSVREKLPICIRILYTHESKAWMNGVYSIPFALALFTFICYRYVSYMLYICCT